MLTAKCHLGIFGSRWLLNAAIKCPDTSKVSIDRIRGTSIEVGVIHENQQAGSQETRGIQLLGKCDVLAEAKHLLRILTVSRILHLNGISEFTLVRRKYRD